MIDPSRRKELEKLALERLNASAEDDEQWSYVWTRSGSVDLSYCMYSNFDEFDGFCENLDLPWSEERLRLIKGGDADPDQTELDQWRRARAKSTADAGEGYVVWIAPVTDDMPPEALAVFMCHTGAAPEDPPWLYGIFETVDEAKAALRCEGSISEK